MSTRRPWWAPTKRRVRRCGVASSRRDISRYSRASSSGSRVSKRFPARRSSSLAIATGTSASARSSPSLAREGEDPTVAGGRSRANTREPASFDVGRSSAGTDTLSAVSGRALSGGAASPKIERKIASKAGPWEARPPEASEAYRSSSLDEMLSSEQGSATVGELVGGADAELDRVDFRQALRPVLAELAERERTIVLLRFFGNMTQTQIADRVGISQMHVSRLLAQTLDRLRTRLDPETRVG